MRSTWPRACSGYPHLPGLGMDPAKPFTFVDDKLACGDSLLGITSLDQLEWMHLDPKRGRALHENLP